MEPYVKVVGIGPGDPRYLTPAAREAIEQAQVLVGGRRQLETFARPDQEQYVIENNLVQVSAYIKSKAGQRLVVLASGDPGLFSIGSYLARELGPHSLDIIPGISSVQLMFARLRLPWQDATILSAHGRGPEKLEALLSMPGLSAVLTGGDHTPQALAAYLLDKGMNNVRVAVGHALSLPEECLVDTNLKELARDTSDYSNSVMVIFNE